MLLFLTALINYTRGKLGAEVENILIRYPLRNSTTRQKVVLQNGSDRNNRQH